ncbi:MAG: SpoIIE family protein phosphatase [Treponema sp.]|jgi:hypothetical protein|nr:SpoIIE family protein phosphatase [Treponema sp.]
MRGGFMSPAVFLMALLAAFSVLALFAALRFLGGMVCQKRTRKRGQGRKQVLRHNAGQGAGLYFKLALFTVALVLLAAMAVSIPFWFMMIRERQTAPTERAILAMALAVLAASMTGIWALSPLVIRPMRELLRFAELARDAGESSNPAGMKIPISGGDEIAMLGKALNEITRMLATGAAAASDLSLGRELQKKFLPLDLDEKGNKLNSGRRDAKNAVFFGYYRGARGISGDYFDFHEIDGRHYAIIKCDVAGKGIPAALIMIQVATMFLNFFNQWNPSSGKTHIEKAVYQINGFIETLGFNGLFAAFTLCIFDSETGELHFCNAGDNIIHIFDSDEMQIKNISLPQTPAAGVLPNYVIESIGGYQTQTLALKHGDILLLYTDGIEESKRQSSGSGFNEMAASGGTPQDSRAAGQPYEEMGSTRIFDIANAVMNRRSYELRAGRSTEGDQALTFDFSGSEGGVEELVMALVAAENMFRCHYNPGAAEGGRVLVEKQVDEFLQKYFVQYRKYCAHAREYPVNNSFLYYTHLREDEQYDDLTILGVKRK